MSWKGRALGVKYRLIACVLSGLAISLGVPVDYNAACAQAGPSQSAQDQSALPAWQIAAGRTAEFDAASIRVSAPGAVVRPNMVLNSEDTSVPPGGHFVADFPLILYFEFAYKIMLTHEQEDALFAPLPKWARTERFVIEALVPGHPTKDQVRLMMQSLLADRFKLTMHFESRETPAFALTVDKPGKLGPGIRPHLEGPPCDSKLAVPQNITSSSLPPGGFLELCGRVQMRRGPNQTVLLGGRDISIDHLAGYLPDFADVGRPIVDQSNLKGTYDFSLNWLPDDSEDASVEGKKSTGGEGPSFEEAIREQLGLRMRPTKASIQIPFIDHIEPPTPN